MSLLLPEDESGSPLDREAENKRNTSIAHLKDVIEAQERLVDHLRKTLVSLTNDASSHAAEKKKTLEDNIKYAEEEILKARRELRMLLI